MRVNFCEHSQCLWANLPVNGITLYRSTTTRPIDVTSRRSKHERIPKVQLGASPLSFPYFPFPFHATHFLPLSCSVSLNFSCKGLENAVGSHTRVRGAQAFWHICTKSSRSSENCRQVTSCNSRLRCYHIVVQLRTDASQPLAWLDSGHPVDLC